MHYIAADGRQIPDGMAGLWYVNAGHALRPIVEAIQRAVATLDSPNFNFGHPLSFELAQRLAERMPQGLNRLFFTNSGSACADTALKSALHYHRARGDAGPTRLIGRERGYHGMGFGGISVGGIVANRAAFPTHLPRVDHLRHTHDLARKAFSKGLPAHGAELADDLERLCALHDPATIAAVIVEPMAGSTGVLLPPVGYRARLREICTHHGILPIFDEVISAIGRLGATKASDLWGVTPDILTMAKGLTNAAVPMGAVAVSDAIYQSAMDHAKTPIELFHGYAYSGHPLAAAAAAALATLDVYREEGLLQRAADLSPTWSDAAHTQRGLPHVIDVRAVGLVAGIESRPAQVPPAPARPRRCALPGSTG
jgi:beta-alanine--pyruvate transaminase